MSYADMVKDLQHREAARRAGPPPNPEADALRRRLVAAEHEIAKLNEQLRLARSDAPMRPSLEVLQRMANGIDPFDHNRFKAAIAALQFETPKLSASTSQSLNMTGVVNIADRLERARLRVINGGADVESADPPTETDQT